MNVELINLLFNELRKREENRHVQRYLRDVSNPFELPEELFRQLYRVNVMAARGLFEEILPHLNISSRRSKTPATVRFFCTLHFLAHGCYQKPIGQGRLNGLSQSSTSRCIHEVIDAIVNNLGDRYIKFPQTPEEIIEVKNGFFQRHELPGIIGCIDCTHIKIVTPNFEELGYPPNVFMNRKHFYSINCQLICDVNTTILGVNARFPGSVHDAAVWRSSNVRIFLHHNYLNGDHNTYLIGDSGYPLLPYLMTPIVGALPGTPEQNYTGKHVRIRNCVERTIGILKGVWRCLRSDRVLVLHYHPTFVSKIIYTCCILHNFSKRRNIHFDENLIHDFDDNGDVNDGNIENDFNEIEMLRRGELVRNRIVNNFCH